jgi:hypothetical protein
MSGGPAISCGAALVFGLFFVRWRLFRRVPFLALLREGWFGCGGRGRTVAEEVVGSGSGNRSEDSACNSAQLSPTAGVAVAGSLAAV